MMASADLVNLVNLSLGVEPNGVVNFNYLHTLLHEIVARLVDHESALEASGGYALLGRSFGDGQPFIPQAYEVEETSITISSSTRIEKDVGGAEKVDKEERQPVHRKHSSGSGQKRAGSGKKSDTQKEGQEADGRQTSDLGKGGSRKSSAGTTRDSEQQKDKETKAEQHKDKATRSEPQGDRTTESRSQKSTPPKGADTKEAEGAVFTGRGRKQASLYTPPQSSASQTQPGSHSYSKSFHGFSMAANDIAALEKQLVNVEVRLCAVETLPELLSKKASDASSTPLSDIWNFSNMDHRLHAAEKIMAKVTKMVDDLLGEFQVLNSANEEQKRRMEEHDKEIRAVQEKLNDLDTVKEMASKSVSTDQLKELQDKLQSLQSVTDGLKTQIAAAAGVQTEGILVTKEDMDSAMADLKKEHDEVLRDHASSLQEQRESLSGLEKALMNVDNLGERVGDTESEVLALSQSIEAVEEELKGKLDSDAMAALMPKGDNPNADLFMPKLLELQNKISQMESKLDGLPPDLKDQIAELRKNIETQTDELSSLSSKMLSLKDSTEGLDNMENLGREVAQLRERLGELDRALMAISSMVSANMKDGQEEDEDPDTGPLDHEEMKRLKSALSRVQQENERLLGTAAQISHEMEVNKEHIKSLHGNLEELKQIKADKSHLELQVRDKADRRALDEKASKNWVRSNFEELDRQIREAMVHMMEREEAMKMVNDLNENVDGKVDRLELQPFKDYVEKRLRVRETRKMESRTSLGEDAAGLKKPLRFSCLSCDKPLGIKPHQAIPALPSINVFPGSRSFRPYTTFELELIRRQQKAGYPIPIQSFDTQRNARTAGGFHTVTHAYRRSRMVPGPFNAGTFTDYRNSVNTRYASTNLVSKHLESDIVGADGHVYKGRIPRDVKMQSIRPSDRRLHHRPTSSPAQTQTNY